MEDGAEINKMLIKLLHNMGWLPVAVRTLGTNQCMGVKKDYGQGNSTVFKVAFAINISSYLGSTNYVVHFQTQEWDFLRILVLLIYSAFHISAT